MRAQIENSDFIPIFQIVQVNFKENRNILRENLTFGVQHSIGCVWVCWNCQLYASYWCWANINNNIINGRYSSWSMQKLKRKPCFMSIIIINLINQIRHPRRGESLWRRQKECNNLFKESVYFLFQKYVAKKKRKPKISETESPRCN